jgi:heme A synthase
MPRVAGYWLLSSAAGAAGLVILGDYVRLFRDEKSLPNWRPSSWIYPKDESQWQYEYKVHKQRQKEETLGWRSGLELPMFKKLYHLDWQHRTYAMGLGAYIGLPLLGLWRYLAPGVKGCVLGAAGLGGLMVAVDWLQVYYGLVSPPKSTPVYKAIYHSICYAQFSLLLWGGLTQLRPDSAGFIKTLAILQAANKQRSMYLLALTFLAGTLVTGGLVTAKQAGAIPLWYEDVLKLKPFYRNFTENKSMILFCHQTCSYSTALAVVGLWLLSMNAPLGVAAAHLSLLAVSLQIISGAETHEDSSRHPVPWNTYENSLVHETLSLVLLTILLVGFHGVRKPVNIRSLISPANHSCVLLFRCEIALFTLEPVFRNVIRRFLPSGLLFPARISPILSNTQS